uniref:ribosomal protein S4 n=1 Tax=Corydalis ternata TaxID=2902606 RepID=UPI001E702902|nr:ribosomal protein S4 [Corydalis ternata]UGO88520.1 ribosomal protein S4 [Corydalis ternata]WDA92883.1 ribosomal protein S4 [Corydalis ternata]
MSRYRGPRLKKIKRLGALPGLTSKVLKPLSARQKKQKKEKDQKKKKKNYPSEQYLSRLEEKQKLRFHYGLTERQLLKYVRIAGKTKGSTGQVLLQLLEMRLDNIIFRLGMASTIPGARQLVNHRHILVNGCLVDIPSYRCKPQDIITTKDEQKTGAIIQNYLASSTQNKKKRVPEHLTLQSSPYKGVVKQIIARHEVGLKIKELQVVEYYSRQT